MGSSPVTTPPCPDCRPKWTCPWHRAYQEGQEDERAKIVAHVKRQPSGLPPLDKAEFVLAILKFRDALVEEIERREHLR